MFIPRDCDLEAQSLGKRQTVGKGEFKVVFFQFFATVFWKMKDEDGKARSNMFYIWLDLELGFGSGAENMMWIVWVPQVLKTFKDVFESRHPKKKRPKGALARFL